MLALAATAALAASALAFVTVYSNSFGSKSAYKEVVRVGGGDKACDRDWNEERKTMRIDLDRGPAACTFKPPVQGDGPQPDHRFDADGRILESTSGSIRDEAYLSAAVRAGGGRRYQLRVFPDTADYELRRKPTDVGFPATGTDAAIREIGRPNRLRLLVEGDRIRAFANNSLLADVVDVNAGELDGTKVEFAIGSKADSRRNTIGNFDRLKLAVPDP